MLPLSVQEQEITSKRDFSLLLAFLLKPSLNDQLKSNKLILFRNGMI